MQATPRPVSVKLRLCDAADRTPMLAMRLAQAGASVVTLHARHVAPNRRRAHAAQLAYVAAVRHALDGAGLHATCAGGHCRVLSNGNVRSYDDVLRNLHDTRADGVMVGEPLLLQPHVFAPSVGRRATLWEAMHTYLALCTAYPLESPLPRIKQHLAYMVRGGLPPSREARHVHDTLAGAPSVADLLAYVATARAL